MRTVAARYNRGYSQAIAQMPSLRLGHPLCQQLYADWPFPILCPNNQTSQIAMMYDTTRRHGFAAHQGGGSGITYPLTPWGRGIYVDGFSRFSVDTPTNLNNSFKVPFSCQVVCMSPNAADNSSITQATCVNSNSTNTDDTLSLCWQHTAAGANRAWQGRSTAAGSWLRCQYPNALNANTWYDLTVTVDAGNTMRVYQDGAQVANAALGNLLDPGTDGVLLGVGIATNHVGLQHFWNGTIVFFRLWTRVLLPSEVRDLHGKPFDHYALT